MSKRLYEISIKNTQGVIEGYKYSSLSQKGFRNSQMTTMESLPPELKIMIFDNLPGKDLMNMAATNKATYGFIRTSERLMSKIVFVVHDFAVQKLFLKEKAKEKSLLLHRVRVTLKNSGIRIIKGILGCLESVTELELNNILITTTKDMIQKIQLPNLKTLKLTDHSCSWKIIQFLNKAPITFLELKCCTGNYKIFDDSFRDWLCSLKDLKTLQVAVSGDRFRSLMKRSLTAVQFKLTKLSLYVNAYNIEEDVKTLFWNFYANQNELKTLTVVDNLYHSSGCIFACYGLDLQRLKSITLGVQYIRDYPIDVLKANKIDEMVTSLTYKNEANLKRSATRTGNSTSLDACFKIMPNSRTALFINHNNTANTLKNLGRLCTNILLLNLECMKYGQYNDLAEFKKTRHLSLEECFLSAKDWNCVVENLTELESITMNNFVISSAHVACIITKCKKLKRLVFGRGMYPITLLSVVKPNTNRELTIQINKAMAEQLPLITLGLENPWTFVVKEEKFKTHPEAIGKFLQTKNSHLFINNFINNFESEKIDRMVDLLVVRQILEKMSFMLDYELNNIFSDN